MQKGTLCYSVACSPCQPISSFQQETKQPGLSTTSSLAQSISLQPPPPFAVLHLSSLPRVPQGEKEKQKVVGLHHCLHHRDNLHIYHVNFSTFSLALPLSTIYLTQLWPHSWDKQNCTVTERAQERKVLNRECVPSGWKITICSVRPQNSVYVYMCVNVKEKRKSIIQICAIICTICSFFIYIFLNTVKENQSKD